MKIVSISLVALLLTACAQSAPVRSAAEDEGALMQAMVEVSCLMPLSEESAKELSEDEAKRQELTKKAQEVYSKHGFTTDAEIERANKIGQEINDSPEKIAALKEKFIASDCNTEDDIERFFTPLEDHGEDLTTE